MISDTMELPLLDMSRIRMLDHYVGLYFDSCSLLKFSATTLFGWFVKDLTTILDLSAVDSRKEE